MSLLGVDTGGTFTDSFLVGGSARALRKVPSTPDDPAKGALGAIRELLERDDVDRSAVEAVRHGSTVATNAVIEHEGARTGLVTTAGFRDVLHIGRHKRPENYSIQQSIPWQDRPLVRRRHRKPVPERVDGDGMVQRPLDEDAVRAAARDLRDAGVDSVAVCFLNSYLDPTHERRAKELVADVHPDAFVTTSSEVSPQFREFERFTTAAMNAFLGPPVARYLERFLEGLANLGLDADLHVMQSNGGLATADQLVERPVMLAYSGPAAGVTAARWRFAGAERSSASGTRPNLVTLDMGGTSADIGLVVDGEPVAANVRGRAVGDYPVLVPMLDLETIGAGGGSIAYLDDGGAFRVGPKSAGADPGPACYGRGGTDPTVTDAQAVLGRLRGEFFLGGEGEFEREAARAAVTDRLCDELDADPLGASLDVLELVNSNMANAIRTRTVQRGRDPAGFCLVAFGGAGPLHAAALARELDFDRVVVPRHSGVFSAQGVCAADLRSEFTTSSLEHLADVDTDDFRETVADLTADASAWLREADVEPEEATLQPTVDCRYEGQGYELTIEIGADGGDVEGGDLNSSDASGAGAGAVIDPATVAERFHEAHAAEFGHRFPDHGVELVTSRVTAVGTAARVDRPQVEQETDPAADHVAATEPVAFRTLDDDDREYDTPFYERTSLRGGHEFDGPAVVTEPDSTTVVPPDFTCQVGGHGDLELRQTGWSA